MVVLIGVLFLLSKVRLYTTQCSELSKGPPYAAFGDNEPPEGEKARARSSRSFRFFELPT